MAIWGLRWLDQVVVIEDGMVIGRAPACDLVIDDGVVSRRHAQLHAREGGLAIEDLGSRHGTIVNGQAVRAPVPLRHGDRLRFGEREIMVIDLERAGLAVPPPRAAPIPRETPPEATTTRAMSHVAHLLLDAVTQALAQDDHATAAKAMGHALAQVTRDAQAGAKPEQPLVDRATELAVGLAGIGMEDRWIRAVVDLVARSGRVPSDPVLDTFLQITQTLFPTIVPDLRDSVEKLQQGSWSTDDRARLARLLASFTRSSSP